MPTMTRDVERLNTTGRGCWLGLNGAAPYGPLMDTLTSLINRLANRIIGAPGLAIATPASKVKTAAAIHCMIDDAADQWLLAHGYKAKRGAPDMGHLWEAPNELVWPYAGTDSVVGAILDDLLDAPLDAANLRTVYDNERIPMAVDYAVHDREGLRVNPMKLEQFSRDLAVARDLIKPGSPNSWGTNSISTPRNRFRSTCTRTSNIRSSPTPTWASPRRARSTCSNSRA